MVKIYYLCLVVLIIFPGCGGKDLKPDIGKEYPASRYMTAQGLGQTESEARNRAVAEMSRIFESRVRSDTYDRVKAVVDASGTETARQDIESTIRVVSEVELTGVELGRTWFDKDKNTYYALSVLDRYKARDKWANEIRDMDGMIEGEFKVLNSVKSKFLKLTSLKRILGLWIEREVIVSRLRVLGFQEKAPAAYDMKSVFHMIPRIKSDMLIFVDITGARAREVRDEISELLNGAGYMMSDTRNRADVIVTGKVNVEPVELKNPEWKFARAAVSITVTDTDTGLIVGEITGNKRGPGRLSYPEAVRAAIKKISGPVSEKLIDYFETVQD